MNSQQKKFYFFQACQKQNLSAETIKNLSAETIKNLSAETINNLSAETINNLSAETINNLSAETINNLSAYTINNLSAYTINNLSAYTINNLSAETINNLSAYTINNLSAYTINNLSAYTINNLSAYTIKNLSAYTIKNLSAYTIKNLSAEALKTIEKYKKYYDALPVLDKPYTRLLNDINEKRRTFQQSTFGDICDFDPDRNICGSAMCTAGHWVNMMGKAGYDMYKEFGWEITAAAGHHKVHPDYPPQNFSAIPQEFALGYIEFMSDVENGIESIDFVEQK